MCSCKEAPKFWNEKKQTVLAGVDICKTPTQLAEILGTYVWVFSGDPEFGGDVEEMLYGSYKNDKDFITKQSITLGAVVKKPHSHPSDSEPVEAKNVCGHVAWGTGKVAFDGVRRVRERWSSDAAVPWMESYWEVLLTEDKNSDAWLDMEGNAVGPAAVIDDNGCPFLVFDWHHPPGCHSSWSGYYLGKRLVKGKGWRLTDEERDRLGIGRTFRSVERSMKEGSPGVYEEDSGEEDSEEGAEDGSGEDDNEEGADTGGDNEEGADTGKDLASEEVGEKRKASNDETGTNKRRRA